MAASGDEHRVDAAIAGYAVPAMARETDEREEQGRPARDERPAARGDEPDSPTELRPRSWLGVLKRTWREFREDRLVDWAAALTYYGVLSLFPGLLVLASLLGLVGASATQPLLDNLGAFAPGEAKEIATSTLEELQRDRSTGGMLVIVGLAVALWSASNYVGAFIRASNAIYEIDEGRPFWKVRPLQIGVTIVMVLLLALCALAVVLTGPLAETAGSLVGLGSTAVAMWEIAKWPVIAIVFMAMLAFLFYAAPNVRHPSFRWVSPGAILAVVIWLIASGAFAFYVANFGSYNKTYGTLAGVIVFLTWLWISNIAVLLGAELNAEVERGRQIERGMDPDKEPFLEPRDRRKLEA